MEAWYWLVSTKINGEVSIMKGKIVAWPTGSGTYKVVQIYLRGEPMIYFADIDKSLHYAILAFALQQHGIHFEWIELQSHEVVVPALEGEGYRACGMGKATVDIANKTMRFSGASFHYSIAPDTQHMEEIASLHQEWKLEAI